jgi:hypothetical protein
MEQINEEKTFCLMLYSQADWCSPAKLTQLLNLMFTENLGTPDFFNFSRKIKKSITQFDHITVIDKIKSNKADSLEVGGNLPQPYSGILYLDRNFAYNKDNVLLGTHLFGMERYMTKPGIQGKDLKPWLSLLETYAQSLELRCAVICRRSQEEKSFRRQDDWVSPQYIRAVARVMLFGPREVERFGREVLLAAPAYRVRELAPGYILLITSPDSLDANAPEDEKALDELADYLFAQPGVSVLM